MANDTDGAPVDLSRIQGLAEGDKDFEQELIGAYLEDCSERMGRLRQAIADGAVETVQRDAHTIKGASSNVGTTRLHELARQLEKLEITAEPAAAEQLLAAMITEYASVRDFFQDYLRT